MVARKSESLVRDLHGLRWGSGTIRPRRFSLDVSYPTFNCRTSRLLCSTSIGVRALSPVTVVFHSSNANRLPQHLTPVVSLSECDGLRVSAAVTGTTTLRSCAHFRLARPNYFTCQSLPWVPCLRGHGNTTYVRTRPFINHTTTLNIWLIV